MRSRLSRALAACFLVLIAASGCSSVDLTDGWPAFAEPTGWEPKAEVCTSDLSGTTNRVTYTPIDCSRDHVYETVYIGQFKGDAAALDSPPGAKSAVRLAAWNECDAKATEYLGGPWRDGRLAVSVSVPSSGNWEGGARWFRCEISVTQSLFGAARSRFGSLKGAFAQASSIVRLGCFAIPKEAGQTWPEVECTTPHSGEYVGSFISTESWAWVKDSKNHEAIYRKCLTLVAAYVGVPDDRNISYRSGSAFWYPKEAEWTAGDHGVRCFLYFGDRKLTVSLKGGGTKALPVS